MAERLSISPKTLRKAVIDLGVPHFKIGNILRFDAGVVEAYLMVTEKREVKRRLEPVSIKNTAKVITSKRFAEAR